MVMVRVRVSLQEINASLCNVPESDHGLMCVYESVCVYKYATALPRSQ